MKILGRIKKSKVLTAVMTAVLIFQSACPTGLAYAAEQARSSAVLTVTASVDDLDETLPTLKSPTDFTAGSAIGTCPAFWVANDDGTSYVEALMAKKQKQGLALNWYNEETGESFDWYKTKVTDSIHVVGKWEKYDVSVTFSADDGTTKSDTETVPYGQSYKQAFGKEKAAPATRAGYEFAGWYDSTTNKKFDFDKKLTAPTVSVYAKWNLKDAVEVSPSDTARPAQTATGTCSINGTWFGTPFPWGSIARFNLSNFTGELAGATVNDAQCVDSGAEKSFHASCIANAVIERGFSCLVTDIKQVVNLMESSFEKRSGNLERILAPDLLILEDLGAQRSTEYVMEHVYDVIDGRYKAGKPMVITTNFDFRERILNATADDPWGRVFDRIVEVGFPVKYDGNSRRREIGMKNRKDFKRKLGIEGIES